MEALEKGFCQFITSFQQASRQYTTRQLTWFRGDKDYHWIEIADHGSKDALDHISHNLSQAHSSKPREGGGGRLNKEEQRAMKRYQTVQQIFIERESIQRMVSPLLSK